MRANLEKSEAIFKRLNEIFSHIYVIKAFGTFVWEIRRYFHSLIERMRLEIRSKRLEIVSELLRNTSNRLFLGVVGFYGSLLVIKGEMTLGSLGALMIYINLGIGAYAALSNLVRQIVLNRILLERVSEPLDVEPEIKESRNAKSVVLAKGKIEFRNVTFGYTKDQYVLDNMNFCILPNAHIAITGASGQGKTTILNLILRLYDVNKGTILLDNYDLKNFKFQSIYSQIGIALQEPFLWNDTIISNILYGSQDTTKEEVIKAAKIAEAHNFILDLPRGYNSMIGELACKISEGQKQRIAIARAIIKKPKILILDEAMSSLDSETEGKIINNIKCEFKDSVIIVVSHRLSTIRKMDLVYFLESCSSVKIGTFEQLIENSSKYKELFTSQINKMPESEVVLEAK